MKAQQDNSSLISATGIFRWLSTVWLSVMLMGLSSVSVRPDWHRTLHEAGQIQSNKAHPCPELPDSGTDSPHLCAVGLISAGAILFLSPIALRVDWSPDPFIASETGASELPQSFLTGRCSGRSPPLAEVI